MKRIILLASLISLESFAENMSVGVAVDQDLSIVLDSGNTYRGILGDRGLAFDYILKHGSFNENNQPSWYLGGGVWYRWNSHDFGLRVPLGVHVYLGSDWDLYAQVHPELGFYHGIDFGLSGALGIKYKFN